MTEEEYLKNKKIQYDNLIKNTDDFFNLTEQEQDTLLSNPFFDYVLIWDKLDSEHRMSLTMLSTFKYETLWIKLNQQEIINIIYHVSNFDPNEYFQNMSFSQRCQVVILPKFDINRFWSELDSKLKFELITKSKTFNPKEYLTELSNEDLDNYCKFNGNEYYYDIWNDINMEQKKMLLDHIQINHRHEKDEIIELIDEKMFDRFLSNNGCLKWNILTKRYNIDLKSFDKNLSYIIFNILKKIKHLNYNDLTPLFDVVLNSSYGNFPNLNQGTIGKTIKCLYPHRCVVKQDNRYFYHKNGIYDQNRYEYSELIGYNELMRETKLKRIC
ncbi:hypothetical protein M0Q97_13500 [Candidatus Dojkabacteria bacterium]|jgi:hypothetical protein|nr:hypothetical protein [Candidatus Dojkabacteria bacterium]